ncbi:MAG: sulfite exporter TauE/SafE family protein [Nitrospira sp.]|nr:sulfite exporter TauE/SafE family protein [Nitrospira sp.]
MTPTDPIDPQQPDAEPVPSSASPRPSDERDRRDQMDREPEEDRQFNTAEMMVGVAMMFVGFLNVLLSISGGFEINVVPLLLYFAGMAVWAHATIANLAIRYTVITVAVTFALGFFHYGEVLFWHKQVVFWATIAIVAYFMFQPALEKKKGDR